MAQCTGDYSRAGTGRRGRVSVLESSHVGRRSGDDMCRSRIRKIRSSGTDGAVHRDAEQEQGRLAATENRQRLRTGRASSRGSRSWKVLATTDMCKSRIPQD